MQIRLIASAGIMGAALILFALSAPTANSLTLQQCSAQYKSAQTAGTLDGMTWNAFQKAECSPYAAMAQATTTETAPAATKKGAAKATKKSTPATQPPATGGAATFPPTVAAKYASESKGKARMHTCRDQYNANKTTSANGGLKWIQKGGGYYSECNKRLKI